MKEEIRDWLIEQAEDNSIQDCKSDYIEDDDEHPDYEQWFRDTYCSQ